MTAGFWILGVVIAVPLVSVALGLLAMLAWSIMPDGLLRVACAMCGRHGYWHRRNSCGYHLCDDCASHGGPGTRRASPHVEEFRL